MLKDLTRSDWLGFLDLLEDPIPPVLVLRGTRNPRRQYDAYCTHFTGFAASRSSPCSTTRAMARTWG